MRQTKIEPKQKTRSLSKRDMVFRKIIEYGLLALIVFALLPAASVYEWSILVIELTVLVMLVVYLIMKEKPQTNLLLSRAMKWPRIFFWGLFFFIFIQIIPFPKFLVKFLSPSAYSFRALFVPNFSKIKFISFSLIPTHTLRQGLEFLTYFLIGFLIIRTITKRSQIVRIYSVLIGLGVFEAFYGMFELYNKNPRILFYKKVAYLDSVTGTFVNRNHLSGFLEMVIPLTVGLVIAKINLFSLEGMEWRRKLLQLSEKGIARNFIISLSIIVMAIAIIFSKSRSGVFLLIFSFLLFFELSILYIGRTQAQRKWIKNFLKVVFLIITLISLYIGIGSMIERFSLERLLKEKRPVYWANTIDIFTDYPLMGTGLGTFPSIYPDMEQSGQLIRLYHAHNDYLEYLSELGIIGFILLLSGIFYMLIKSFLIWRERRHPEVKGLALGGIIAIICILLHSITDFNLHIPANMLVFSVVISLTMVTAFYRKRVTNSKE